MSSDITIKNVQTKGFFNGKSASVFPILIDNDCTIAVGLGKKEKFGISILRKAVNALYHELKSLKISDVSIEVALFGENPTRQLVEALINAGYHFDRLKSEKQDYQLQNVEIINQNIDSTEHEIRIGQAIANGQNYAKDLKNLPANICNTDYLLNEAKKLAASHEKMHFHYLDEIKMHSLKMGCITAVGQGSDMPTYIACMEYFGADKSQKPIVLVGKGMVYDSGGLCLKPWQGMSTMKMDMGGAAAVFGTMKAVSDLNLPINVIGAVALVENSIDGNAYRPGDVLTSMKGITVEVGNTDAEGRLALCDTLSYIEKYHPETVIDVATLTGAMVVSLGSEISGLFANDQALADQLKQAAAASDDPAWQMPLYQDYHELLKSDVADMNNIGGSAAGSITAALFLSRFAEDYRWAHLDIAGSAMGNFEKAKASGRPVPLLTQYILNQSQAGTLR